MENLGVSYVKGTEQYQSKLEAEIRKLKFSYRVSKRGKISFSLYLFLLLNVSCGKWLARHIDCWKVPSLLGVINM